MKGFGNSTKLIFLPLHTNKQGGGNGNGVATPIWILVCHNRLWLIAFFFTFVSLIALYTKTTITRELGGLPSSSVETSNTFSTLSSSVLPLPPPVFDALVNYAVSSNSTGKMVEADIRAIAAVLRRRGPCNLLVFGLGHETPLWRALNHGGRTVFIDENEYYIAHVEKRNPPGLEAYDVAYTTKVRELPELLEASRQQRDGECRPVQNLLFSDCRLAINDLPNHLYDVAWDVILVDGPRGYTGTSPGRISAIFTAAVMARSVGDGPTDVLVHDYEREVERVCGDEFLCLENLVEATKSLAHYVIRGGGAGSKEEFCVNRTSSAMTAGGAGAVKL